MLNDAYFSPGQLHPVSLLHEHWPSSPAEHYRSVVRSKSVEV